MQLTLQVHHVTSLDWSSGATTLRDGTDGRLLINRADLAAELLKDTRLTGVDFELVQPGESCRILAVSDIVEPRAKLEPSGRDFPGALTGVQGVGFGTTRVLRGMAVTILHPNDRLPGHIIDMRSGGVDGHSATELSRFARLHHLVIIPKLAEGIVGDEAENALRIAVLRASTWLAGSVEVGQPDACEEFALQPVSNDLPRVAYVYQLHSHQRPTVPGEPLLYGDNCRHLLPTILHPNEVLDGAVLRAYGYFNMETYGIQNHGVISDLYARHGVDLNFVGVVVYVANQLAAERQRATLIASNLVRYTLQADGAVFTKSGGGAPNVDMALIADRCESLGVKTSLILWETGAPGASDQDATLFNWPSLDAIVSIGASQLRLDFGPVQRVIAPPNRDISPFCAPMQVAPTQTCGATDHLGAGALMGVRY
jgi:glycine reductase